MKRTVKLIEAEQGLAIFLEQEIDKQTEDGRARSDIINSMAKAAGISSGTVSQILSGDISCPPIERLQGFASALKIPVASVTAAAENDGCKYNSDSPSVEAQHTVLAPTLIEAKDEKGSIWEVMLIRSGQSKNGNIYPPEVLRTAAPLFEGVRALARSDEDHLQDKKKNVKDIVGWFDNVRFAEGNLIADFHISKAADWLRVMIKDAWDQGKRDLVGLSIVAEGTGTLKKTATGFVRQVETIDKVNSVDVIVNPAAGGGFLKLVASQAGPVQGGLLDINQTQPDNNAGNLQSHDSGPGPQEESMKKKLLEALKAKAQEKYNSIDPEKITEVELQILLAEACPDDAEVKALLAESGGEPPQAGKKTGVVVTPPPTGNTPPPSTPAAGSVGLTEAEVREARTALDQIKKANCRLTLTEALSNSKLPEPVRAQVRNRFAGRVFDLTELSAEIELQKDTLAKLSESGNVSGLGLGRLEIGVGERQKLESAMDGFFAGINVNEVTRFSGFAEAYVAFTGDSELTFRTENCGRLQEVFAEALTSPVWGKVLGDSIARRMVVEYLDPVINQYRDIVSEFSNIKDFRPNPRTKFGGYGAIPDVAESGSYDALSSPGDTAETFTLSKRGGTETVTMEMIANDDQGAVKRIPRDLGRAAARTLRDFVFGFILSPPTMAEDSKALFHTDHDNLLTAALSDTALNAVFVAMQGQAAFDTPTNVLGLTPKHIIVPRQLRSLAWKLAGSEHQVGSAEGTARYTDREMNYFKQFNLNVIVVPNWSDATDWATVCDVRDCPTIEIGFYKGRQEPEIFVMDNPSAGSVFTNDKITYKIRHIYNGTVLDFRGMSKNVVT